MPPKLRQYYTQTALEYIYHGYIYKKVGNYAYCNRIPWTVSSPKWERLIYTYINEYKLYRMKPNSNDRKRFRKQFKNLIERVKT